MLHSLSHTSSCTHSYCTISFHSLFFRKCLALAAIIVPVAMLYRQNVEGKNSKNLQLALCGTAKQEVGEAAEASLIMSLLNMTCRADVIILPAILKLKCQEDISFKHR